MDVFLVCFTEFCGSVVSISFSGPDNPDYGAETCVFVYFMEYGKKNPVTFSLYPGVMDRLAVHLTLSLTISSRKPKYYHYKLGNRAQVFNIMFGFF